MAGAGKSTAEVVAEGSYVDLTDGGSGPRYVVQTRGCGEAGGQWADFCMVMAPPRSKRKTIIEAALRSDAGKQLTLPARVRVLDADAAREHPVGLREREPELVIG